MAVELCSENLPPRISFSDDLDQSDGTIPIEQLPLRSSSSRLDSSLEFDFCVCNNYSQDFSSADELFSDGKILPVDVKKKKIVTSAKQMNQSPKHELLDATSTESTDESSKKGGAKEVKRTILKSFWRFRRSCSLDCLREHASSLCPAPLIQRSKSTRFGQNAKQTPLLKSGHRHKQNSEMMKPLQCSALMGCQKATLRKSYKNGIQLTNPVLNVSFAKLFCLGSVFPVSRRKKE